MEAGRVQPPPPRLPVATMDIGWLDAAVGYSASQRT